MNPYKDFYPEWTSEQLFYYFWYHSWILPRQAKCLQVTGKNPYWTIIWSGGRQAGMSRFKKCVTNINKLYNADNN